MVAVLPAQDSISAVVIGDFTPSVFLPTWFSKNELIGEAEERSATIEAVVPDLASIVMGWLRVQVTRDRLYLATDDASRAVAVRDLCIGVLTILDSTPVRMCGINRLMHFSVSTPERWHSIGHALAPKQLWNAHLSEPGLRSVSIRGQRPGSPSKQLTVKVEPSPVLKTGVFFDFNEHYGAAENSDLSTQSIINLLTNEWDVAQAHFLATAQAILSDAGGVA